MQLSKLVFFALVSSAVALPQPLEHIPRDSFDLNGYIAEPKPKEYLEDDKKRSDSGVYGPWAPIWEDEEVERKRSEAEVDYYLPLYRGDEAINRRQEEYKRSPEEVNKRQEEYKRIPNLSSRQEEYKRSPGPASNFSSPSTNKSVARRM